MKKTFCILSLILAALDCSAADPIGLSEKHAKPEHVAKIVADNVVRSTKFSFVPVKAKSYQKNMYLVDFSSVFQTTPGSYWAKSKVVFKPNAGENHLDKDRSTALGVSHSAGTFTLYHNKKMILRSTSSKNLPVASIDYQLNTFSLTVPFDVEKGDELSVHFIPSDERPHFYVGPLYLSSGMAANKVAFEAGENVPFLVSYAKSETADRSQLVWKKPVKPDVSDLPEKLDLSDFRYFTGTFLDAMHQVSQQFGQLDYSPYITRHTAFFFDNLPAVLAERNKHHLISGPFDHYDRFLLLDDFGPQLLPFLRDLSQGADTRYRNQQREMVMRAIDVLQNHVPRLEDGTLTRLTPYRLTVQSDDLFMGGVFLIRAATTLDRPDLLDDAVTQTLNFHRYLYDQDTGLYRHGYFAPLKSQTTTVWGRGVGWMAMTYVELLAVLPETHPSHKTILRNFRHFADAMLNYQGEDGRWHQILNDPDTYPESSVTAMFVRALAEGLVWGWLDGEQYRKAAQRGWLGLASQIDTQGNVSGIVRGTPIFGTPADYANHGPRLNDPRGLGAILYAAVAMDRLEDGNAPIR